MAINLASKYEKKVAERFKLKSFTEVGGNRDYNWVGVNAIEVYSIPTVALGDYSTSGTARYGTPTDLQNTKQTMTLAKDRAFSIVNDKKSLDDTMGAMNTGKALGRQIDEVIVPEIDAYRLTTMSDAAISNSNYEVAAVTAANAYVKFLNGQAGLDEDKVNVGGRVCFTTPTYHNFIKQDSSFMLASNMGLKKLVKGEVGEVDGVKFIKAPSSYFPTGSSFILVHPSATVFADKLQDYKIHSNPPGINGDLIEGRVRYDAFVLDAKKDAIWAHYTTSPTA